MIAFYKLLASFLGFMFPVFLTKAIREILKENGGEQKYIVINSHIYISTYVYYFCQLVNFQILLLK